MPGQDSANADRAATPQAALGRRPGAGQSQAGKAANTARRGRAGASPRPEPGAGSAGPGTAQRRRLLITTAQFGNAMKLPVDANYGRLGRWRTRVLVIGPATRAAIT